MVRRRAGLGWRRFALKQPGRWRVKESVASLPTRLLSTGSYELSNKCMGDEAIALFPAVGGARTIASCGCECHRFGSSPARSGRISSAMTGLYGRSRFRIREQARGPQQDASSSSEAQARSRPDRRSQCSSTERLGGAGVACFSNRSGRKPGAPGVISGGAHEASLVALAASPMASSSSRNRATSRASASSTRREPAAASHSNSSVQRRPVPFSRQKPATLP